MFLELNSKGLYQRSRKEKLTKFPSCVVRPRQNVNLGTFTRYDRAVTAKKCSQLSLRRTPLGPVLCVRLIESQIRGVKKSREQL